MKRQITITLLPIGLVIFFLACGTTANAATITVTNTNDSGAGSLRQAIADATPASTINFDPSVFAASKTITLTSGQLVIDKNLTIQGRGASLLSVSGNNASRAFYVSSGVTATLDGMTISDGYASLGGGIRNDGTLTIINSTISDNRAKNTGGGIASWGMLTVINSTILDNRASYSGGILSSGTLTVINSAISVNTATSGFGGGINYFGTLTISNSTISGNFGSGIEKTGTYGAEGISISHSTISGNSGPGIFNRGGSLVINNSTISDNMGDGIYNAAYCDTNCYDGLVSITHSTISGNGVGIFSNSGEGPALEGLRNTIVAGNTNSDISGTIETASHNLIGDAASSGGIQNGVNGNIVGVNPLIGHLRNNGGPTLTHALLPGSPAINAGNNCVLTANGCGDGNPTLPNDQRGFGRVGVVDIGAFERQNSEISSTAPFDFDGDGKTDISVFRPAGGIWFVNRSSDGALGGAQFGLSTDEIVPGDFTGDGKTDIAVWRPSTGQWFVLRSEDGVFYVQQFGSNGDVPAPADYDADGKTDLALFRPSNATWFIQQSGGGTVIQGFGLTGDHPVAADYDGDGRADIAVWRPSGGTWWILRSSDGALGGAQFGLTTDKPVQGDYTGDGKTDIAVWRPSTGFWYVLRSEDSQFYAFPWGLSTDVPAPGDFDGDGKFDASVFRPSAATWFVSRSTAGTLIQQFGAAGDQPVPGAFVP